MRSTRLTPSRIRTLFVAFGAGYGDRRALVGVCCAVCGRMEGRRRPTRRNSRGKRLQLRLESAIRRDTRETIRAWEAEYTRVSVARYA
eukprot:928219-Rhodomonas_salina.1